jgi:thiol-disulfide isomerase/thioredoxin
LAFSFRSESRAVLAFIGAGWLAVAGAEPGAAEAPLEVTRADGSRAELSLPPGDAALIVHFWASWCPECVRELPGLERAAERCSGVLTVAAVNVGESEDDAEEFRARHGLRLPLLRDPDGALWRRFARGLPANLIWTRAGGREVLTGPQSPSQWEQRLSALGCDATNAP